MSSGKSQKPAQQRSHAGEKPTQKLGLELELRGNRQGSLSYVDLIFHTPVDQWVKAIINTLFSVGIGCSVPASTLYTNKAIFHERFP
ncbi:hypothetical protein Y1Q_0019199 [Alligator mississippiensis]|uniref:Uncharacterized protein n=1 Tax=Alligator mississippiensis TaxID=8496 RepID=A0A151MQI1_ALLMI|nr:hypothetical protein Y1Q_0019199 [Alligator mississippiensis]